MRRGSTESRPTNASSRNSLVGRRSAEAIWAKFGIAGDLVY